MPLSWGEAYIMQRGRRINDCTRYHETSVKNVASAHLPIRFMVCTHAFHCFTMLRYYADDRTREIEEVYYLKKKNGQDGVSDTWKEASFLIRPRMHESGCDIDFSAEQANPTYDIYACTKFIPPSPLNYFIPGSSSVAL